MTTRISAGTALPIHPPAVDGFNRIRSSVTFVIYRTQATMQLSIINVNYADARHAAHLSELLDAYARDPMGGGKPLEPEVRTNLAAALARLPYAFSLLAYTGTEPVGLATCFESFSTFACRPIINIHDFMVTRAHRGKGVSQHLLRRIEDIARGKNCCKISLEVLTNNEAARGAYRKFGFQPYQLDPAVGTAEFWHKPLEN